MFPPQAAAAPYWSLSPESLLAQLGSAAAGLGEEEAAARLERHGRNELHRGQQVGRLRVLLNQVKSPLVLLLVFAAVLSGVLGDWTDTAVVGAIVAASAGLGFWREYDAGRALARLEAQLVLRTRVLRAGSARQLPAAEVVPGDVVLLAAGSLVPADGALLEADDLFVSEAALTGESFPVEKRPGALAAATVLAERTNSLFLGTHVRSGTGHLLVVHTGRATAYGAIAERLRLRPPETEFDRGLRQFGAFLTTAMLLMALLVFAINVLFARPAVEALLFSVALAVGLAPELLPAILTTNLARSAQSMARRGVLVRRLNALENLGTMDVLCTDKTGTLTEGVVRLQGAYDAAGRESAEVRELAALNARLQAGLPNPLDEAIALATGALAPGVEKLGEVPYDFVRKRLSVVVRRAGQVQLIAKGALEPLLEACELPDEATREQVRERYRAWSEAGCRVLGVAVRGVPELPRYGREHERALAFAGFLVFTDRPKPGVADAVGALCALGVQLKVITGDNVLVARQVMGSLGLPLEGVLTGAQLDAMRDEALWHAAERTQLFAQVDPHQKERIILALKKTAHVVGYMGDGINDAPAMHAADVSISVEQAVDVAKEAADFVLLRKDLDVLRSGVLQGRITFANTLKYLLTTMSANLGNMVSMALASLVLPFLPLLASQILLNNFLSDVPALGLAGDAVDPELVERPRRWDMGFIRRFMLEFGVLSSVFDWATFAVLLGLFHASQEVFRTGWFLESVFTELAIALVVRTRRRCYRSRPGRVLLWLSVATFALTLAIPLLPGARLLGFVPLPAALMALLLAITAAYVVAAEVGKAFFYRQRPRGGSLRA